MTDDEAEAYLDKLATADLDKVRRQLAMGQLSERKRALASQFLESADRREINDTARSAKNAAWAAAIAATVAAMATGVMAWLAFASPPS